MQWNVCALLVVLGAAGCRSGEKAESSPASVPPEGTLPAEAVPAAGSPDPGPVEVPALDTRPVGPEEKGTAEKFNAEGLRLHRAGDHAAAVAAFASALRGNPGHILARYNMSCAYALSGQRSEALAVLRAFKEDGCPACLARLERARVDPDWASFKDDAEFQALVGAAGAGAPASTIDAAAQLVAAAFASKTAKDRKAADSLFGPGAVRVAMQAGDSTSKKTIKGAAGFASLSANGNPVEMKLDGCKKDCCKFSPVHDDDRSLGTQLREVCFAIDAKGARTVSKLSLSDEF